MYIGFTTLGTPIDHIIVTFMLPSVIFQLLKNKKFICYSQKQNFVFIYFHKIMGSIEHLD